MDGEGSEELAVNRVQDENVDNSQGYVEIGRIENDDEVIIVQIENPNVPNPSDAVPHNRSPDDTNPLEQPPPAEVTSDEGILTPNRKKRKRSCERKVDVKKMPSPMKDEDDDGSTCSICLDSWESCAEHRLVATKCGHLFGESCIKRWLQECSAQAKCCPTCKSRALVKDIRPLFAKKVLVVDRSEEYRLRGLVEEERSRSKDFELRLNKLRLEMKTLRQQCSQLEAKIELARLHGSFADTSTSTAATILNPPSVHRSYRMSLERNFEMNREPGCRSLVYGSKTQVLFVSQKSHGALFPGYGVRTVSLSAAQPLTLVNNFMLMATKQIRDLSLDADEELIISASSDKSAKMFSVPNRCQVSVFTPNTEDLWASTFDKARTKTLYLGSRQGKTYVYDLRNPQAFVQEFNAPGDCSPVVDITSVPANNELPFGGFAVCKLQSLWFYEYTASQQIVPHKLIAEGPFASMTFDERTNFLLIGTKPSTKYPQTRYMLANLTKIDQLVILNTINTIFGEPVQTVMSRSAQIHIENDTLVSAYKQQSKKLTTWNARTSTVQQSLDSSDLVYDLCPMYANNKTYLAALSETRCRIYQLNCV